MKLIDASGLVLGRLASRAAKLALNGEEVKIVNCEKAVISGKKEMLVKKWVHKFKRTDPFHGPFHHLMPDKMVKRAIRGMLPRKKWAEGSRGRLAFGRIRCHIGIPQELKGQEFETMEGAQAVNLRTPYKLTIAELSQLVRGKKFS